MRGCASGCRARSLPPRPRPRRLPRQQLAFERARTDIGELTEQRPQHDRQHQHVHLHELARVHRHVAEALLGADRLRDERNIWLTTVRPDGRASEVQVLEDSGHGFGPMARRCALLD